MSQTTKAGMVILNAGRVAVALIKGWEKGSEEAGLLLHDLLLDEGCTEEQCKAIFSHAILWARRDSRVAIRVG